MPTATPQAIELSPSETDLLSQFSFDWNVRQPEGWIAARELVESLIERGAIPAVRWRWITDGSIAFTHGKSRADMFVQNAGSEEEMMEHPHFLPYLWYFIYGPKLSAEVIKAFCESADEMGTSGMQLDRLCAFARKAMREWKSRCNSSADAP